MSVLQTGFGNSGGDYTISRSVRLRSSASAYLNRTPASTGNQQKMTLSFWVKRGTLTTYNDFLTSGSSSSNFFYCGFAATDKLLLQCYTGSVEAANISSSAVFRDPSAWYHIVYSIDMTQASSANGLRLYVNGVQQTVTISAYVQNANLYINTSGIIQYFGRASLAANEYLDGYLTEVNFIDGQALTPSSFGETDAVTGVWKPKKYAGTYGTNGFYLNFSDNSNNTAATIGKDSSGNGNNWTPNNISVTSGVTYDSMTDVPTLNSATAANYCVWNPLDSTTTKPTNANLRDGHGAGEASRATVFNSTGKWYFEFIYDTLGTGSTIGIGTANASRVQYVGSDGYGYGFSPNTGNKNFNGASTAYGATCTTSNVIGVAYDLDNGKIWWSKDGVWQASGDPAAGTNAAYTGLSGEFAPMFGIYSGGSTAGGNANFGQRPFAYTPPTGFKALNTFNLPDATIKKGSAYFDVSTWTGNGSAGRAITTNVGTVDFAWVKLRSGADDHRLANTVTGGNKHLKSNATDAEGTGTNIIQSFSGSTFTVGSDTSVNGNGSTYVGWVWQAGGTAASNTSGSITSSVSAGVSQGFSVVTWTGTGSTATVGHGLGVAPKMIIVKSRSGVQFWRVYFNGLTAGNVLYLNTTDASSAESGAFTTTAPTSSVFSVGTSAGTNGSGATYVAYCFAEVAGYSKAFTYTGNGSTDGPFVYTGMRPRFVLIKRTDAAGNEWFIYDTARDTYNVASYYLLPNSSGAEGTFISLDILSNGFKLRTSAAAALNASGGTYIGFAFSENPFKYSLAR